MGVPQGHADGAVTQEITHRVQRDVALNQARGKVMAQIAPTEPTYSGALENLLRVVRMLERVTRSRKTVAGLRPSFRRRAFHDPMRSTKMAVSGSGYHVPKIPCTCRACWRRYVAGSRRSTSC